MHLLQQVASGRAGGRDTGGLTGTKLCVLGDFFFFFFYYSNPHKGGVGGHPVIQCDGET